MSADANGTFPRDARPAAELYLLKGLCPIPLPLRSKAPAPDFFGWQECRPTVGTLDQYFPAGSPKNIGVLTGAPSARLIDVDLDSPEAITAADFLLPRTACIFGRPSQLRSHRLYRPTGAPATTRQYHDLDGKMLVELRGDGLQTMFPPSIHPAGEHVMWSRFEDPGECLTPDLEAAVAAVAAAALLARHWPDKGTRDKAAMALSGGLTRAGWPEEKVSNFALAVARAAGDEEARARANKADRTAAKQQDGKKTTGWPELAKLLRGDGEAVVRQVREWLRLTALASSREAVTPEPPAWPDPPGEEAFYGLAGRVVRTIEPASEADAAALLIQTLIAFGNVIGRGAHFTVEADRHYANESAVLVGRTAKARKGTSWGRIDRLYLGVEEQWAAERVQSGASSGEGIIWAVRDPITKQEKIKARGEPVRYESVEADPGIEDKRLLIYEPEYANVLKQAERQGNTLSVILRNAWDGRDLRSLTKNSPAKATGAHVSLLGHITSDELRRYLTETEMANGYGNRHLWLCVDRSKVLPDGGRLDSAAWEAVKGDLGAALAYAKGADEVTRDDEAGAIWREIYGELSEGRPGLTGALLARGEAHVMRLAMIYALMDSSAVIGAVHLQAALALWDYAERSVYYVFGDHLGDPLADELQRTLRASPNGLTRNDLMNYLGRHQSSDRIGRALGLLLQHKLARCERQDTGGRPAERWFPVARKGG
jgi:hypothetical protein